MDYRVRTGVARADSDRHRTVRLLYRTVQERARYVVYGRGVELRVHRAGAGRPRLRLGDDQRPRAARLLHPTSDDVCRAVHVWGQVDRGGLGCHHLPQVGIYCGQLLRGLGDQIVARPDHFDTEAPSPTGAVPLRDDGLLFIHRRVAVREWSLDFWRPVAGRGLDGADVPHLVAWSVLEGLLDRPSAVSPLRDGAHSERR